MRIAEKGLHAAAWERAPEIPARMGRNVEVYAFHAHKAQHRQKHFMALGCVTQSHGLGEIDDYDNSDVFHTVCLLQGLLLNSCSKSCEWRKKGRIVSSQSPKPDSSGRRKEGKLACCWWFHCESTLSQPLWRFKNVKRISNSWSRRMNFTMPWLLEHHKNPSFA